MSVFGWKIYVDVNGILAFLWSAKFEKSELWFWFCAFAEGGDRA